MEDGVLIMHCSLTHMCLNVKGAIERTPKNKRLSFANHDDGRAMTNLELRAYLTKAVFEGKRVLPMGDCDNFDDITGCRGHGRWSLVTDVYFETGNG